jgi:hypothetical protein
MAPCGTPKDENVATGPSPLSPSPQLGARGTAIVGWWRVGKVFSEEVKRNEITIHGNFHA